MTSFGSVSTPSLPRLTREALLRCAALRCGTYDLRALLHSFPPTPVSLAVADRNAQTAAQSPIHRPNVFCRRATPSSHPPSNPSACDFKGKSRYLGFRLSSLGARSTRRIVVAQICRTTQASKASLSLGSEPANCASSAASAQLPCLALPCPAILPSCRYSDLGPATVRRVGETGARFQILQAR